MAEKILASIKVRNMRNPGHVPKMCRMDQNLGKGHGNTCFCWKNTLSLFSGEPGVLLFLSMPTGRIQSDAKHTWGKLRLFFVLSTAVGMLQHWTIASIHVFTDSPNHWFIASSLHWFIDSRIDWFIGSWFTHSLVQRGGNLWYSKYQKEIWMRNYTFAFTYSSYSYTQSNFYI